MKTIGIKLADGSFYPVVQEGSSEEINLSLTTANNNQTKVIVDLYRSRTNSMEDAEYVDSLQIENLNAHPDGEPDIALSVHLDENNQLHAKIVDSETGAQSNSTVTLVSRTLEQRLNAEQDDNTAVAAMATGAAVAGVGLLAAAEALNKDEDTIDTSFDETVAEETENIEVDVPAEPDEPVFDEESSVDLPDFEEPPASDDMPLEPTLDDFRISEEVPAEEPPAQNNNIETEFTENPLDAFGGESHITEKDTENLGDFFGSIETSEETAGVDETVTSDELPNFGESTNSDELPDFGESTVSEETTDFDETPSSDELPNFDETPAFEETPNFNETPAADELPDFGETNISVETPDFGESTNSDELPNFDESPASDELPDFGESPAFEETPNFDETPSSDELPDFDEVSASEEIPDTDEDTTIVEESPVFDNSESFDESETFETSGLPDMDFDLPDTNENDFSDDGISDDDFFHINEDEPAAASNGISFTGLYDKPEDFDEPQQTDEEKSKVPVIICVTCAIICLIAVFLLLFILPTKFNLIQRKQKKAAEPAPVEVVAVETPVETPEVEPVQAAKEDEVIIIEKAEEVVPLPPPVKEEKPGNITYKIKWGDTLWDISDTYYKNPWKYKYLARFNGIKDPDYIISGTYIIIPAE